MNRCTRKSGEDGRKTAYMVSMRVCHYHSRDSGKRGAFNRAIYELNEVT